MHARINLAVLKLVHILWLKFIVKFLRSTDMYVADLVQGRYVRVRSFGSDHLTICGLWQGLRAQGLKAEIAKGKSHFFL